MSSAACSEILLWDQQLPAANESEKAAGTLGREGLGYRNVSANHLLKCIGLVHAHHQVNYKVSAEHTDLKSLFQAFLLASLDSLGKDIPSHSAELGVFTILYALMLQD